MSVLDQNEIDSLLASVDDGGEEEQSGASQIFSRSKKDLANVEVRDYDFKRPERVSKDQMMALETLHEAFARNFGASLSGFLRTIVEVRVAACEQMTYGEFVSGLPNPTSYNLVQADNLDGQMCLEVSPLIIYPIIDRLLGGNNQDLFIPQRPMTPIEQRLISNLLRRGLEALSDAWSSVAQLKFDIVAHESNPQLVQIVPPNEVVMVIGLEMRLSARAGTMNLCIPYNVIEPVMDDLSSQSWFAINRDESASETERRLTDNLDQAAVQVSATLAETTITLKELTELQVGDLIVTTTDTRLPAVINVENEPRFIAEPGRHKRNRAVRVIRSISKGERIDGSPNRTGRTDNTLDEVIRDAAQSAQGAPAPDAPDPETPLSKTPLNNQDQPDPGDAGDGPPEQDPTQDA